MTPSPIFLNRVEMLLWCLPDGNRAPVCLDLRRDHGDGDFIAKAGAVLAEGVPVALWDPEEEWSSFTLERSGEVYTVEGERGACRGTFITIEAAMKFGLTAGRPKLATDAMQERGR